MRTGKDGRSVRGLQGQEDTVSDGKTRVAEAPTNQAILADMTREVIEAVRDQASADLATRRLDVHEKNAWMLRSHLE